MLSRLLLLTGDSHGPLLAHPCGQFVTFVKITSQNGLVNN